MIRYVYYNLSQFSGGSDTSTATTGLPTGTPLDYTIPTAALDPGAETISVLDYTIPSALPDIALDTWEINFTAHTITLNLHNVADASTLDVTKLTLQDAALATVSYTLQDSTTASVDGYQIVIDMGVLDLAALTTTPGLTTGSGNSYLRVASGAILDLSTNSIATLSDGHARQTSSFTS